MFIRRRSLRLKRLELRLKALAQTSDWLKRLLYPFDDPYDLGVRDGVKYCVELMQGKPVELDLKTKRIYRGIVKRTNPKIVSIKNEFAEQMGFRLAYDPNVNEPPDKMVKDMKV